METPWYQKFFSRVSTTDLKATKVKADRGDAKAQFALGLQYGAAEGASQDLVQAAQWYRKAADQNHSLAQFNLGIMYAKGQGMPVDDAAAVMWIRRAADEGDAGAQFNLGTRHHRAIIGGLRADVAESRIEAYKWLQLAAAQGYKDSAALWEQVALGMTREEVTEGNHRAATFVAGKPANPQAQ